MYVTKEIIEEMLREGTFKDCTSSRTNPRPPKYACISPINRDKTPVSLHYTRIKQKPGEKLSFPLEKF